MHRDEGTLRAAVEADIDTLMQWFREYEDINPPDMPHPDVCDYLTRPA